MRRRASHGRPASWPWPPLAATIKAAVFFLACAIGFTLFAAWEIGSETRAWRYFAAGGCVGVIYVVLWARRDFAKRKSGTPMSSMAAHQIPLFAIVGAALLVNALSLTVQAACMGTVAGVVGAAALYALALAVYGRRHAAPSRATGDGEPLNTD